MPTPEELTNKIAEAATQPAEIEVTDNGLRTKEHPLPHVIAAQRHVAGAQAAKSPTGGLVMRKALPPGTV